MARCHSILLSWRATRIPLVGAARAPYAGAGFGRGCDDSFGLVAAGDAARGADADLAHRAATAAAWPAVGQCRGPGALSLWRPFRHRLPPALSPLQRQPAPGARAVLFPLVGGRRAVADPRHQSAADGL